MTTEETKRTTVTEDDETTAKELGESILALGIELSKGAGFQPASDDPMERAQELLKDAIPRVMESLKADGFL
jgi:hypothetical protein